MKEFNVNFQIAGEMHCETYRNITTATAAFNEKIGHCELVELCAFLSESEDNWFGDEIVLNVWKA